jgi:hypothetical protein
VGGSIPPASTTQDFHAHRLPAVPRTSGAFARRAQASFKVRPHLSRCARQPDRSWAKSLRPGKLPNARA